MENEKSKPWMDLTRRAVEGKAEAAQEARDLEKALFEMKLKVTEVEKQRDAVEASASKRIKELEESLARIAHQAKLWNRGSISAMGAVAGILAEVKGFQLEEPGLWERRQHERIAELEAQLRAARKEQRVEQF